GGGSIPLEALRIGCDALASDLNPVACLILKVMLEDIPRHGSGLAEELRRAGAEIRRQAEQELAEFYPNDPDGAMPIAYLWARTVRCESPNCGAEIPLVRSFWLCKKANRKWALRYKVVRSSRQAGDHVEPPQLEFEIFEPESEMEVPNGTVTRARATCRVCGAVLPPQRVRAQLAAQRGGADVVFDEHGNRIGGARLLAVVSVRPDEQGRYYRLPTHGDYKAVWKAQKRLREILDDWAHEGKEGPSPVPDELLPPIGTLGFRVQRYGMLQWGDLFTARQKVALVTLTRLTARMKGAQSIPEIMEPLALALSRAVNACCSLCRWNVIGEKNEGVYSRQALPIVWDYSEVNPLSAATGGYEGALDWVRNVIQAWPCSAAGQVECADASQSALPAESVGVWFTDPPYYDAIPYADLSDFFFVWLKRALPGHPLMHDPFDPTNRLTPKGGEIVQNERSLSAEGRPKDREFYEQAMARAFAEGRRVLREDGIGCVVFAHKTTEGWEALLSGMTRGGWTITGSWPIATEMGSRLRARDSAALATSVHLVCRPRPEDASVGDWADVLRELPRRVGDWMERLQREGVRGADLVFACIGPALEIFSRYARVETADGREVTLAEYLQKVWEVVGRTALEQVLGTAEARARNGAAGALEEDARLTALFLWTLQTTNGDWASTDAVEEEEYEEDDEEEEEDRTPRTRPKGYTLIFDVVRRFAQPLGISLPKWEGRIIETKKGVVRLLPVAERATQLFGRDVAEGIVGRLNAPGRSSSNEQLTFLATLDGRASELSEGQGQTGERPTVTDESLTARPRATTLDRVHMAMLLQAGGQTSALRALLKAERERGPDFFRLANALS
ncbi:MAG: DUF1156 domain-containing protein, partial [Synergistales bacterium]|nr:DUF1156 domain-containing protein [Synergistales bacterium]